MTDIIGKKFNKLTVVSLAPKVKGKLWYWCQCECNSPLKAIRRSCLLNNLTASCGCLLKKNGFKHGHSYSPLYTVWLGMVARCYDKNNKRYDCYGGRGITVCDRWLGESGLNNFILDMGMKPSSKHSIDRIDTNDIYCPTNCTWSTAKEQARNRRCNRIIYYKDKQQCLAAWCEELKLKYGTILNRLDKLGWSIEKSFTTPTK